MNIKGYVIVAVLTAFVSWLVFSPDDESSEPGRAEPDSGSDLRALPREPETLPPRERHGIVRSPDAGYGTPYPHDYGQPRTPVHRYRPFDQGSAQTERFSFRPLTERERERLATERPAPGYYPESIAPRSPAYSQTPRARERSRREPRPWFYPQPDWQEAPESGVPWTEPAAPQWGSTPPEWAPPAERMYPSLDLYPDRMLTAEY